MSGAQSVYHAADGLRPANCSNTARQLFKYGLSPVQIRPANWTVCHEDYPVAYARQDRNLCQRAATKSPINVSQPYTAPLSRTLHASDRRPDALLRLVALLGTLLRYTLLRAVPYPAPLDEVTISTGCSAQCLRCCAHRACYHDVVHVNISCNVYLRPALSWCSPGKYGLLCAVPALLCLAVLRGTMLCQIAIRC